MTRLVQIQNAGERRVALVEEPHLRLLGGPPTVLALAELAVERGTTLPRLIEELKTDETVDYDRIYRGASAWRLLAPIDHPEPGRCLVSGTGLTHLGSAKNRNAMHEGAATAAETDSMKMFRWGVEGGKPAPGKIGTAPEWFFKGTGKILRAHGEPLDVPDHAEEGGEEAEIAGVYLITAEGRPCRIGMAIGNEFADHRFEKRNYLNLAASKIRNCSLGPELVVDPDFQTVSGEVSIERDGRTLWSKAIATGEAEMCHSLANIEHHHFKFETHRQPGDVHVHYYGAHSLSFGDGVELANGDVMCVAFDGYGRPLRNTLRIAQRIEAPIHVQTLA
jgi:hypothetical protein